MSNLSKKESKAVIWLAVFVGGPIWLYQNYPGLALVFIVLVICWILLKAKGQFCSLCDSELKRKVYEWKIDGKKHQLCPNCNRQLEHRKSKEAITRL